MDAGLAPGAGLGAGAAARARPAGTPDAAALQARTMAPFGAVLARALGVAASAPVSAGETPVEGMPTVAVEGEAVPEPVINGRAASSEAPVAPHPAPDRPAAAPRTGAGQPESAPPVPVGSNHESAAPAAPPRAAPAVAHTPEVPAHARAVFNREMPVAELRQPAAAVEPVRIEADATVEPAPDAAVEPSPTDVPVDDAAPVASPAPTTSVATATVPVPVRTVERSLERLVPEFRTRLERVIDRMQSEHGLTVRVVETFRTQQRQDALFEQGRTEPGPTVTWTRASNHTLGRAADLRIEGGRGDRAYAQLARIAAEEGLRTLGPRDPGHIELPGAAVGRAPQRSVPALPVDELPARMVRVASVARVAQVAQPARVARVATVARPGSAAPSPAAPALPAQAPAAVAAQVETESGREEPAHDVLRPAPARERAAEPIAEPLMRADAAQPAAAGTERAAAAPSQGAPSAIQGNDIAARVARLLAMRDATAEAPTTGMTLLLDGADGTAARIRLGVRGAAVGATIDVADAVEAARLGDRIGDLRRALERHGLEPATVTVRDVPALRDAAEITRAVGTTVTAALTESGAGARSGDTGNDRASGHGRRDSASAQDREQRRNPREGQK